MNTGAEDAGTRRGRLNRNRVYALLTVRFRQYPLAFADESSQNGALCGVLFRLCRLQAGEMDLLLKGLPRPEEGLA